MRLMQRVAKLEQIRGPFATGPCPGCGGIDPITRSGIFYGGVIIENYVSPGVWWCFCKRCARSFSARGAIHPDGGLAVEEVTPCEGPI